MRPVAADYVEDSQKTSVGVIEAEHGRAWFDVEDAFTMFRKGKFLATGWRGERLGSNQLASWCNG